MNIYILSTTNEWKNPDYTESYWVGTNVKMLLDVIYKGILGGTFEWSHYDADSREDQAQDFLDDMDIPQNCDKFRIIQTHLDYGLLEVVESNNYV